LSNASEERSAPFAKKGLLAELSGLRGRIAA
jgi:hypothetical protein